jgi:hypothetical protein
MCEQFSTLLAAHVRQKNSMTEEALQIDFQPQPKGIAVVTSAPISTIAESGNCAAFQDLIDGYASSFAKVHVFSPSGEPVVKPAMGHRVSWHSGPRWLSPTNGLWWSVLSSRGEFGDIELVRTFGPRAGVVGKALSKLSRSPHVSSSDDLNGNVWRDHSGWRSAPGNVVNRLGLLRANMLVATLDWEVEYLSETGYKRDLLLGKSGLPTDIYTPVGTTDPNRHPVVLWAGPVGENDSISLITESALATRDMIENVEFIVVANDHHSERLRTEIADRELPITVASVSEVEPLVDLIERTWACVTVPTRGFPHGFGMYAASAGIPIVSVGELAEAHGFKSHLNYMGVESNSHEAVAYALQLLRRWSSWSLRIGSAGQQLIEDRYSTKTVAVQEGEQLARVARGEAVELDTASPLKTLDTYKSPATGKLLPFGLYMDTETPEFEDVVEDVVEVDQYSGAGFDLVAAALADISGDSPATVATSSDDSGSSVNMGQDAISALFANDSDEGETPSPDSCVSAENDLDQDAISALFASEDSESESESSADMNQDAILALFASTEPEPAADSASDMDQDAISALFATEDAESESESEPEVAGDMDQDAISALFASDESSPDPEKKLEIEPIGEMDQDAISALFGSDESELEFELVADIDTDNGNDMEQDAISALFAEGEPDPIASADSSNGEDEDFVAAILEAKNQSSEKIVAAEDLEDDTDMPQVNIVKFDGAIEVDEEEVVDEFDTIDVDPDLIESILAGKDVDPYS